MDTANFATKSDIAEVKSDIAEVKGDIAETKALIEKTETSLLTAFHKYAQASERRMSVNETLAHTLSDRVAALETRMRELESKR
jgi:chromosome segregation ATPase